METVTFGDGRKAEYSYGPLKQLVEIRDWLGKTTAEYDRYGRVMKITDHRGKSVAYEWGSMNQKNAVIYPDGSRVNYFYDNLMRLKELTSGNNRIGYRYGENGLPEEISCNNGLTTSYCYNHAGKITGLTHKMHDAVLEDYKYEYDKTGNKTGIFKYRRGVPKESGTFRYGYDRAGRLTSVEKDGKMLREYAYDSFHNRSRMEDSVGRTEYTYDSMDQMVQSMGMEQYAYHYDKRGNLIEILQNGAAGNSYAYDAMGKIREAGTAGGEGCRYIYNGAGMRVSREEWGIRNKNIHTDYVLDMTRSCHNLLVRENGETKQKYLWGNLLAGMEEEGRDSYALLDELGSPVRFLWRNGNDLSVYGYDEFGNDLFGNAGDKQPFGFTGYLADGISGTYFAQAREYAPESGRFYGEDIIPGDMSAGVSLNRYIYCANDPVNYVDWDGRLLVRMLVGAVVGMAADFGAQVINNVIEGKNVFDLDNYNGVEILMSGVGGALMAAVPSAANWFAKNAGMEWLKVGLTYIGNAAIAGTTSAVTEKVSNPQATSEDIRNVAFRGAIWSSVGTTAGYLVGKIPLISNISKTAEYDLWRVTPMGGGGYTTQSNPQVVRNNVKIMQRLLFGVDQGTSATTTIAVGALGSGMRIRMEEEKE